MALTLPVANSVNNSGPYNVTRIGTKQAWPIFGPSFAPEELPVSFDAVIASSPTAACAACAVMISLGAWCANIGSAWMT